MPAFMPKEQAQMTNQCVNILVDRMLTGQNGPASLIPAPHTHQYHTRSVVPLNDDDDIEMADALPSKASAVGSEDNKMLSSSNNKESDMSQPFGSSQDDEEDDANDMNYGAADEESVVDDLTKEGANMIRVKHAKTLFQMLLQDLNVMKMLGHTKGLQELHLAIAQHT